MIVTTEGNLDHNESTHFLLLPHYIDGDTVTPNGFL